MSAVRRLSDPERAYRTNHPVAGSERRGPHGPEPRRQFETSAGARKEAPLPEKTRLLRITRDQKLCPKTVCYKWHLVTQRAKLPRAATIDLAQLRLAPSLREATENGQVELIINAVERRKGRENVTFVATSLYGVMPHDEPR